LFGIVSPFLNESIVTSSDAADPDCDDPTAIAAPSIAIAATLQISLLSSGASRLGDFWSSFEAKCLIWHVPASSGTEVSDLIGRCPRLDF
jgi:hypothetical protein